MPEQKKIPFPLEEFKTNGDSIILLSKISNIMKKNGRSRTEIDAFYERATSSDYDHLLVECLKIVELV